MMAAECQQADTAAKPNRRNETFCAHANSSATQRVHIYDLKVRNQFQMQENRRRIPDLWALIFQIRKTKGNMRCRLHCTATIALTLHIQTQTENVVYMN